MTISKSIAVGSTGVDATLWKIRTKEEDYVGETIKLTLDGYVGDAVEPILPGGQQIVISGASYSADMTKTAIEALLVAPVATVSSAVFDAAEIVED